jgi:hypothetical protein
LAATRSRMLGIQTPIEKVLAKLEIAIVEVKRW